MMVAPNYWLKKQRSSPYLCLAAIIFPHLHLPQGVDNQIV
jgi:hypothetical protein